MLKLNRYLALILVLLMSCHTSNKKEKMTEKRTYTYLALGDSYTIGESVLEAERWPNQLAASLNENSISVESPRIIAKTGWTTDELQHAINDSIIDPHYDIVSLLIGVNNQYRGRSVENFREEFIVLLNKSIAYAANNPANVFVVSIPDWGMTPFAQNRDAAVIADEIDSYNQVLEEECLKKNTCFINITDISRNIKTEDGLIAEDGLHPSGKMYQQWVERMLPILIQMIKN